MTNESDRAACAGCARCERLPEEAGGDHISLWLPLGHTVGKVRRYLRQAGLAHEMLDGGCLHVTVAPGRQAEFAAGLRQVLTERECADALALRRDGTGPLPLAEVPRLRPLGQFLGRTRGEWLVDMLRAERVTSHFQPIVPADDPGVIFAQEALFRGVAEDGALVPPHRVFEAGRDAGLLFPLDLAARRSAIREAGRHGLQGNLFINFNPTAIYDPEFCLRSTVQAVHETRLRPENVVFEIIESDRHQDTAHLRRITDFYRAAGFRTALDDVGAGYASLNLIHQLRPDFLKLDMELIRGVHADPYKALIARKLLEIAQELGIETVAEGVECVEELDWARAHGADYVQGYWIAKPAAVPVTRPFGRQALAA